MANVRISGVRSIYTHPRLPSTRELCSLYMPLPNSPAVLLKDVTLHNQLNHVKHASQDGPGIFLIEERVSTIHSFHSTFADRAFSCTISTPSQAPVAPCDSFSPSLRLRLPPGRSTLHGRCFRNRRRGRGSSADPCVSRRLRRSHGPCSAWRGKSVCTEGWTRTSTDEP